MEHITKHTQHLNGIIKTWNTYMTHSLMIKHDDDHDQGFITQMVGTWLTLLTHISKKINMSAKKRFASAFSKS
jgi:hypothetical protein